MDHQIEHDVNVERPRREDAEAMDLEEHRLGEQRKSRAHRGIETFQVADLRDAAVSFGCSDQLVGLGHAGRQRLLDQHVHAGLHQLTSDREMQNGGNGDRDRVDPFRNKLSGGKEGAGFEFSGDGLCAREIVIGYAHELNAICRVGGKLAVNAGMIASEGSSANNAYAQCAVLIRHRAIVAHGRGTEQRR